MYFPLRLTAVKPSAAFLPAEHKFVWPFLEAGMEELPAGPRVMKVIFLGLYGLPLLLLFL